MPIKTSLKWEQRWIDLQTKRLVLAEVKNGRGAKTEITDEFGIPKIDNAYCFSTPTGYFGGHFELEFATEYESAEREREEEVDRLFDGPRVMDGRPSPRIDGRTHLPETTRATTVAATATNQWRRRRWRRRRRRRYRRRTRPA